jgi:hypothetical protein
MLGKILAFTTAYKTSIDLAVQKAITGPEEYYKILNKESEPPINET